MSTLKTNTIQHLTSGFNNVVAHTDGAGTANAVHCRAWVNFDGTGTVSIRASFNVSSITDRATGRYTMNFSNSLADANYAIAGASYDVVGLVTTDYDGAFGGTKSASGCTIGVVDSRSAGYSDYATCNVSVFR